MLNIEVIKFEAQDVITASAVAKPEEKCTHPGPWGSQVNVGGGGITIELTCNKCGAKGRGATNENGNPYPAEWYE